MARVTSTSFPHLKAFLVAALILHTCARGNANQSGEFSEAVHERKIKHKSILCTPTAPAP